MESLEKHIRSKNYVAGIRQLSRCLTEQNIAKIFLAADADEQFKKNVLSEANVFGVEVAVVGSKKSFAALCGIQVDCAVIGILKTAKAKNKSNVTRHGEKSGRPTNITRR